MTVIKKSCRGLYVAVFSLCLQATVGYAQKEMVSSSSALDEKALTPPPLMDEPFVEASAQATKEPIVKGDTFKTDESNQAAPKVEAIKKKPPPEPSVSTADAGASSLEPSSLPASQVPSLNSSDPKPQAIGGLNKGDAKEAVAKDGNIVIQIGKNNQKNIPTIERFDDDEYLYKPEEGGIKKSQFFKGGKVEQIDGKEETIRYVYLSRGAWLIKKFQPYLDRLSVEVMKSDSPDLTASYIEVSRTFSYLCLLLTSDDGTKRMESAVSKAIALHREGVTRLRMQWPKKSEELTKLFDLYLQATFYQNLDKDSVRIPAGSFSKSQYKNLKDTYPESDDGEDGGLGNPFSRLTGGK